MPNQLERRRSPRVAAANHPGLPAGLIDVSVGGLSIRLTQALPAGTIHDVSLPLPNGTDIVLRVRVAYSRHEPRPGGRAVFVTGLAFLADVTHQSPRHTLRLAS